MVLETHQTVEGVPVSHSFSVKARTILNKDIKDDDWSIIPAYATDVASINLKSNDFKKHPIAVAALNIGLEDTVEVRVRYTGGVVQSAKIRPSSLGIQTVVCNDIITFNVDRPIDVMLEINADKYESLHVLVNQTEGNTPSSDSHNLWYFGPGLNMGSAYAKAVDGTIFVPSDTTIYLALGAFVTAKFVFSNVSNARIVGQGFVNKTSVVHTSTTYPRELSNSAVLIERSTNINVSGITSLGANGFSLPVCQSSHITIQRYRSFSSGGNGDGIDLFCCHDILIDSCFLRNSDDTIAIYGHRWNYSGDTENIHIKRCVLLPDIAHPFQMGTHGNPGKPERMRNVSISDIDILDHEEHQVWYQGCISINAADENLIENVYIDTVRVERITKGQLFNIRVMQNPTWTTAPGRGVRNVTLQDVTLVDVKGSGNISPSQILGYDSSRTVENILFKNLLVGGECIHEDMVKPRWYSVADLAPMYINEHVSDVRFVLGDDKPNGEV